MRDPLPSSPDAVPTEVLPTGAADVPPGRNDAPPREIGGREGPDPTRFGDWERAGRCIDF